MEGFERPDSSHRALELRFSCDMAEELSYSALLSPEPLVSFWGMSRSLCLVPPAVWGSQIGQKLYRIAAVSGIRFEVRV